MSSDTALSRPRNPDREVSQLVVDGVPKAWLDMLDAESFVLGLRSRQAIVRNLIEEWVRKRAQAHMVYERVVGGNQIRLIADSDEQSGGDA